MKNKENMVVDLIEHQARLFPERSAVLSRAGDTSYRDLVSRARSIADLLLKKGIRPEAPIGVHVDRSATWIAAIFGVMYSGGTYVPVNPMSPLQRKAQVLEDAGVRVVLTESNSASMVPRGFQVELLDAIPENGITGDAPPKVFPEQAAYGIFTSGSMGMPKHVVVSHASLSRYAQTLKQELGVNGDTRYLQTASMEFSAAMRQILVPLVSGGTLVLASQEEIRDPSRLVLRMLQARINVFDTVPSYLDRWLEAVCDVAHDWREALGKSLDLVLTTGEAITAQSANYLHELLPKVRMLNLYGQTETTGTVAIHRVGPQSVDPIPIGPPLQGCEFYVLNDQLEPAENGELYVSGSCLARGYLGQPSTTATRFIPNPFFGARGARMYRTGDRVRRREDGGLQFVGRSDRQVKFHGIRIELDEIETALRGHSDIKEAAVVMSPGTESQEARLRAFVTLRSNVNACEEIELRQHMHSTVGETMTPGVIIFLDELPRTPSGKIDYSELMLEDPSPLERHQPAVPLSTETERLVARCWAEILQCNNIGADDDFFLLGGDSFQAMRMIFLLQRLVVEPLPLGSLFFEDPTLRAFAQAIDREITREPPSMQPWLDVRSL